MKILTFDKNIIDNLNFDKAFENIVEDEDKIEFFGSTGKEHYRLLSYFSTLFNNSNIIDIGSHKGYSSLALSYNKTNTIYSFDIVDNIRQNIKYVNNIHFFYDNLFENDGREKWKDIILSCPFIFMDVDPHNGNMELDMYNFLKSIDYNGFIICDDIWYFKEMRDNFWYKINYEERYDVTSLGHWSGTGIINMNKNITFEKNNNTNWTLVTAYFNLTACYDASDEINKRDPKYYFSHSISTLSLPYNLVIYCDQDSIETIKQIRPQYLKDKTEYIICNFDDFRFTKNNYKLNENFNDYRKIILNNRIEKPYYFDNRNTASYYLFCMSRYIMLKETIKRNTFKSTHFAWINFCIERMGYSNLVKLDEALSLKRYKFSTCYIDYIPQELINNNDEYFKWGRCSMCSGFFTGSVDYMFKVCDLIEDKFLDYLYKGYGHADEQLYSPVYFENPELFEHYYGDYNQMITNYKYIYENSEAPIYNFITNSFNNKNYRKCYEACIFVWKSYCLNKCVIQDDYLNKLYYYYMNSRKELGIF
jgi:predicted O-methyltransferase YrrM